MRTDLDEVACRDQGQPSPLGNPPRAVIIFLMLAIFFVLAGGGRWTHY